MLGGDRASVLIVQHILPATEEALLALKEVAKSELNLVSELPQFQLKLHLQLIVG